MGATCLRLYEASQGKEPCVVQEAMQGGRQHIGAGLVICLRLDEVHNGETWCRVHAI